MSTPTSPPLTARGAVKSMNDTELRKEYVLQKTRQHTLKGEEENLNNKIEALREESVRLQQSAEVEEECVTNQLFRRLDGAERDVRKLRALIKEEEGFVEDISMQINAIRSQQSDVELQLDHQEEYLLFKLQGKLLEVANRKADTERELISERRRYLDLLAHQIAILNSQCTDQTEEGASSNANNNNSSSISHNNNNNNSSEREEAPTPLNHISSTVHATTTITAPSASHSTASASSDPGQQHATVMRLEKRLNELLAEHNQAAQESMETEKRCSELSQKLKDIQDDTFLQRARAAKLREDVRDAKERLNMMEASVNSRESIEDSSVYSTPNRSMDQTVLNPSFQSQSLRDRTIEVLSSAVFPPPSSSVHSLPSSHTH